MTPPHAPSAQSGTGPGCCASDLTIATANDDRFVDEGAGRSARDGVVNVDPRDTGVTVGRGPHEADGVFEGGREFLAYRRDCKRVGKRVALSGLPNLGFGGDHQHINNLEDGCRGDGSGLDGHDARDSDETPDVFENTCGLGRGKNSARGNEYAGSGVLGMFKNDVRTDVILEVGVDLGQHGRGDVIGADGRSGRGGEEHAATRSAVARVTGPTFFARRLGRRGDEGRSRRSGGSLRTGQRSLRRGTACSGLCVGIIFGRDRVLCKNRRQKT